MKVRKDYVGPAAGFGLLLVVVAIAWWGTSVQRSENPLASPAQVDASSDKNDVTDRNGSADQDRSQQSLESVGIDLDMMSASAQTDADTARLLSAFIGMCSLGLGNEYLDENTERFKDPRWVPWLRECDRNKLAILMNEMASWAQPTGVDWEELESVAELDDSLDGMAKRDTVALRILEESEDPELVAQASRIYFDRERLRAWASSGLTNSLAREDVSDFSVDLALMLACRVGRDCSGGAVEVVAECAATSMCYPGISMEQVIALRQSPQDMILLRRYVQQVMQKRDSA